METKLRSQSRRLYSWWWDSHICPKNSKWLHDNLTDIDAKVKTMIKLIEEDADSFARRAEMYYKKRPELIKLVEEFYRAYRALAEKYDHAQRTIAEIDDSASGSNQGAQTLDSLHLIRILLDADFGSEESKKELKQLQAMFEALEKERNSECEIKSLKKALEDLELEKEVVLSKLSTLERELDVARISSRGFDEEAEKAKAELEKLKEMLMGFEAEKAEAEEELSNFKCEYEESLEKVSDLEKKLSRTQEKAKLLNERAEKAENEVGALNKAIAESSEDKEGILGRYELCLEKISKLESELFSARDDINRLNGTVEKKSEKLKSVEEKCNILEASNLGLQLETEYLEKEIAIKNEELSRKDEEIEIQSGLQNKLENKLKEVEEQKEGLEEEMKQLKDENKVLNESSSSSKIVMSNLESEILNLRELYNKERDEKEKFVEKLDKMKQCLDKNASLSEELEKAHEKIEALQGEKASLVDKKAVILSQFQKVTNNMQKLLERNTFLENSLSGANSEISSLRDKSNSLEDICKFLNNDNSNLVEKTKTLVLQLGNSEKQREDLEKRYAELEKERESTISQVEKLKTSLDIEKQERNLFKFSSETRLNRLEDRVQLLQEDNKKEFEEELDREVNSKLEIFVLQRFIQDMEQKNLSLLLECRKHVEASKLSDQVISELESEILEQQMETEKLRFCLYQVFKALEISHDHVDDMAKDKSYFIRVVENIEDLRFSLEKYEDDKDQLLIENSVLLTFFEQLTSDEKFRDQQIVELKAEIERLCEEKIDMKRAYSKLCDEHSQKLNQNKLFLKTLSDLKEKNEVVKEESYSLLVEALALDNKSIVFKHFGDEKAKEVKSLFQDLQKLDGVKRDLESEVRELSEELDEVRNINSKLIRDLSIGKCFSNQKKVELLKVTEKLKAKEEKNSQLCRAVEELKRKNEETLVLVKNLENQYLDLFEENKNQENEIQNLSDFNGSLEFEVAMLREEVEECKISAENLSLELRGISNEAEKLYLDFEMSNFREIYFVNKVRELTRVCEMLESERDSRMEEIEQNKEKISFLESENDGFKLRLSKYYPAINSTRDKTTLFEQNNLSELELYTTNVHKLGDDELATNLQESDTNDPIEDDKFLVPNRISELQELQNRIKKVEKVVKEEKKRRLKHIRSRTSTKLEAAIREIDELKTKTEILETENGMITTKDIQLNDISNDTLPRKAIGSMNMSRRFKNVEIKTSGSFLELQIEKEVEVDIGRLEVPTSGPESTHDRNKKKVLERLICDAYKLKSIQTTMEDLRSKMDANKLKIEKAKKADFEMVKEQFEEVEDTIIQLFEVNEKLTKSVGENFAYSDKKATLELEVILNLRRKRVADQARKETEKICRLVTDVQKINYMLLDLEGEKKNNGKFWFPKSKTGVILKDFISRKRRISEKKKIPTYITIGEISHLSYK